LRSRLGGRSNLFIIPCHSVIGKNGELVGYGGGMWRKKFLSNLEKKTN
jgi:O6-methylguanine-DNA--protein-cysteine methyltransferase